MLQTDVENSLRLEPGSLVVANIRKYGMGRNSFRFGAREETQVEPVELAPLRVTDWFHEMRVDFLYRNSQSENNLGPGRSRCLQDLARAKIGHSELLALHEAENGSKPLLSKNHMYMALACENRLRMVSLCCILAYSECTYDRTSSNFDAEPIDLDGEQLGGASDRHPFD